MMQNILFSRVARFKIKIQDAEKHLNLNVNLETKKMIAQI